MKRSSGAAVPSDIRRNESGTFLLPEAERAVRAVPTPKAPCVDHAKRTIAAGVEELVLAQLKKGWAGTEWVDQNESPLGKRRHLELVRRGRLPGVRLGKRILVRRSDLEAYLAAHTRVPVRDQEEAAVDALLADLGEIK